MRHGFGGVGRSFFQLDSQALCYAIVAVKDVEAKKKLSKCLAENGFGDVKFFCEFQDFARKQSNTDQTVSESEQPPILQAFSPCGLSKNLEDVKPTTSHNVVEGRCTFGPKVKEESVEFEELTAVELMDDSSTNVATVSNASSHGDTADVFLDGIRSKNGSVQAALKTVLRDKSDCLDTLNDDNFRQRFRMSRRAFMQLCAQLEYRSEVDGQDVPPTKRIKGTSSAIKIGMLLDSLTGRNRITSPPIFNGVLEALLDWSETMIHWPKEAECQVISASFFKITGIEDIVGCLGGTKAWEDTSSDTDRAYKYPLEFVTDHEMRFRWVFAKYADMMMDDMVFRRSLLFEQFVDGTKKGSLVGDDAYKDISFVITPSQFYDEKKADIQKIRNLCEARRAIILALYRLKKQFGLLGTVIKLAHTNAAKVIVLSAALYNFTKEHGEPPFTTNEEEEEFFAKYKKSLDI